MKKEKIRTPITIVRAKGKFEQNLQEGRMPVQPVVRHTKTTEIMSEDTGGDIQRRVLISK